MNTLNRIRIARPSPNPTPSLDELHRQWWWEDTEYQFASSLYQCRYFPKESEYVWAVLWCHGTTPVWKHADIVALARNGEWRIDEQS